MGLGAMTTHPDVCCHQNCHNELLAHEPCNPSSMQEEDCHAACSRQHGATSKAPPGILMTAHQCEVIRREIYTNCRKNSRTYDMYFDCELLQLINSTGIMARKICILSRYGLHCIVIIYAMNTHIWIERTFFTVSRCNTSKKPKLLFGSQKFFFHCSIILFFYCIFGLSS